MSELEFVILVLGFTAYYFIERCLRAILFAYHPSFYEKLRASRKDLVFFGIWMGLLISAFSTPFCIQGTRNSWVSWKTSLTADGQKDNGWSLDPSSKICISSRAILWTSEFNRLDMYGLYVVHHAGSIIALVSFIYFGWPALMLLTLYSTLGSEIPGDMVWMLSSYLDAADRISPALVRFKYHLVRFNATQYTLIRGAGIALVCWMASTNSPGIQDHHAIEQVYAYTLLGLYALFCASYVLRQRKSISVNTPLLTKETEPLRTISESLQYNGQEHGPPKVLQIRFGTHPTILIVPYGLFMGVGFAALVFVSLTIMGPSDDMSSALNLTLVSAVVFARLLSIIMEDGLARFVAYPLRTLFRPGFWLHGGLFGAAVGALVSHRLGHIKNFPMFAGSLAVGLPLYETFSRIGCHTYGCCYGHIAVKSATKTSKSGKSPERVVPPPLLWRIFPYHAVRYDDLNTYAVTRINPKLLHKPLIPIQLISATLFLLLFVGVSVPLTYHTRADVAGSLTLICHAAIRLITEPYRADYRGEMRGQMSTTGRMALVQATGATLWLIHIMLEGGISSVPRLGDQLFEPWIVGKHLERSIFAAILGIVVYGVHIGEVGSWIGATKREGVSAQVSTEPEICGVE